MTTDSGRSPSGRALALRAEPLRVSSVPASIPNASLIARMTDLGEFLLRVEADIPAPTCSSIDAVIRDIQEPRRQADKLVRDKSESPELDAFAVEVDNALWSLPDSLELLRSDNMQLRDGVCHLGSYCHEAGRLLLDAAKAMEARRATPVPVVVHDSAAPKGFAQDQAAKASPEGGR